MTTRSSSTSPSSQAASRRVPVRLFRNGSNQAVRIPRDLELPGEEATIRREGNKLIIESAHRHPLLDRLSSMKPLDEDFPDVDKTLRPLDDVKL
ncbi:MAG: AbrB/MazE/SpoVT family DNA-binding domain-containing protein [Gammaproteobacteria bacterium]|nr:AbrB/MazE/SpoVT family DNA-binding domain-containing protein [Gammaproteobacteria bacterium]MBU1439891.1 AbrB/MazE/SpoVT family DNA-binding domain-containing protein [Gammaproteobacteria bacterium]MBU2285622.1 AbrB/MazE/SpoVT family DNA-binding domain-containing protein [Gammaproteobacteria bacterium]MBU2407685.1 AbrB/MazE/SpoVT family DNA-binding domain-containing protein [Gammaproteobacteria bacterium]